MNLESTLTLGQSLRLIAPELVLLVTGFLILALDLATARRSENRWQPYVALFGLAGAAVAVALLWGTNTPVFYVLVCDPFSLVAKGIAALGVAILVLMSDAYVRARTGQVAFFYALLLFCTLAIFLLVSSVNFIMLLLTFDFLSIVSYVLTGFLRDDPRSSEAGLKYLIYGSILSAVMLYGLSWLYGLTGSMDIAHVGVVLANAQVWLVQLPAPISPAILTPILIFVVAGLAYKVAAAPFHQWAPDAYEGAPTPVTAFLSVGPKVAGFVIFVRITLLLFPPIQSSLSGWWLGDDWRWPLLAFLSAFAMTFGNLAAFWQDNVKRLLAYSSIAQAGYILIGVTVASERAIAGVLLYLLVYVVTNLGAFSAILAFSNAADSDLIHDYRGLYRRAPLAAATMLLALLSLAGIPGTGGFVGKLWLFSAALEGDNMLWLAILGVVNSVISLGYYWKIIRATYMRPMRRTDAIPVSPFLNVALVVTLLGILWLGLFPGTVLPAIETAARVLIGG